MEAALSMQQDVQSPDLQRENRRWRMHPGPLYNHNDTKLGWGEQEGMEKRNQAIGEVKLLMVLRF